MANGLNTLKHVVCGFGVGVMEKSLVAGSLCAGLVSVHARNKHKLVCYALLKRGQAGGIVEHGILAICRARTNHNEDLVASASHDIGNRLVKVDLSHRHLV